MYRIIIKYYCKGAYLGNKELFGKRITPYFNTYDKALHYKQCYGGFSLSLGNGLPVKEEFCF